MEILFSVVMTYCTFSLIMYRENVCKEKKKIYNVIIINVPKHGIFDKVRGNLKFKTVNWKKRFLF